MLETIRKTQTFKQIKRKPTLIELYNSPSILKFERQLAYSEVDLNPTKAYQKSIQIRNRTNSIVAYKVRTTKAQAFSATPHLGYLEPQQIQTITIQVVSNVVVDNQSEKLQVLAVDLNALQVPSDINLKELWKDFDTQDIQSDVIVHLRIQNLPIKSSKILEFQSLKSTTKQDKSLSNDHRFSLRKSVIESNFDQQSQPEKIDLFESQKSRFMSQLIQKSIIQGSDIKSRRNLNISQMSVQSQVWESQQQISAVKDQQPQYKTLFEQMLIATDEQEKVLFILGERKNKLLKELNSIRRNKNLNELKDLSSISKDIRLYQALFVLLISFLLGFFIHD